MNLDILIKVIDKASGGLSTIKKNFDNLDSAANNVNKKLTPLNNALGVGIKAAAGIGVLAIGGLTAAIISSTNAAADMDQKIADIAAVFGTTKDAVKPLKDLITTLGIDPKLKVSATEAAGAIEMLAKNGLDMGQIMDGAARQTILLSNATGADMSTAADIATDAMSLFNIEAKDMKRAVDGITGVTIQSKFGINDYALALGTGAKGAVSAGIGFDQFNQVLTATSSNFTSGMTAGTSLTAMFLGLAPRTDKAAGLMKELGIITEEAGNRFFDANGQIRSNAEVSKVLQETLGKLAPEQRLLAVNTLFGRDAMAAVNGMINTTEESWNKYSNALATTDAEQQAATRMDTLRGSLEILDGLWETLKISIGDKFLPVFKNLVDRISEFLSQHANKIIEWAGILADKIGDLIEQYLPVFLSQVEVWLTRGPEMAKTIENVAISVGGFLVKVSEIIGPIIKWLTESNNLKIALGALATLITISAVASLVSFVSSIVSVVAAVGSFVLALNPVTLIIGAIVLAIIGLYTAWQTNFWGIRDITKSVWDALSGWFSNIVNWFTNFPAKFNEFGTALYNKAQWVIGQLGSGLTIAKEVASSAFNTVMSWLGTTRDTQFNQFGTSLFNAAKTAFTRVGEGINAVKETVKNVITTFMNDAKEHGYSYAVGAMAGRLHDGAKQSLQRFIAGFNDTAPTLRTDFENVIKSVSPRFDAAIGWVKGQVYEPAKQVALRVRDGLRDVNLVENFVPNLNNISSRFNEITNGFKTHLYESSKNLSFRIRDGLRDVNLVENFVPNLNNISSRFNEVTNGFKNNLYEGAKQLSFRVRDGLRDVNMTEFFNNGLNEISNLYYRVTVPFRDNFYNSSKVVSERIRDGLRDVDIAGGIRDKLGDARQVFNEWQSRFFSDVWEPMKNIGKEIMNGLGRGISDAMGAVLRPLQDVANQLPQWIKDKLGISSPSTVFMGIGRNIMEGMAMGIDQMSQLPQMSLASSLVGMSDVGRAGNTVTDSYNRSNTFNVTFPTGSNTKKPDQQALETLNTLTAIYSGR